jgi:hypothetical protein
VDDPAFGRFAGRVNSMPKYVASRTLSGPLEWNAAVMKDDLDRAVPALKAAHSGNLILSGCGALRTTSRGAGSSTSSGSGSTSPLGEWPARVRRRRPDPAAAGGRDAVPVRRPVVALPTGERLSRSGAG